MVEGHKKTAILLFSRTVADEAAVKTFALSQKNQLVAKQLLQHSIATAQKTQLPLFKAYNTPQKGDSFGERLANEIEIVFQKGYESLIIIGNDCPQLTTQHLLQVNQSLQKQQVILGPAKDGGVYLIGLQKAAYQREQFINFAWEREHLQTTWKNAINNIVWLETLSDIDSAADLNAFLKIAPKWHALRQQLVAILREIELVIEYIYSLITKAHFNSSALRAPPSLV